MFLFWTFAAALAFTVGSACMKASEGMTRTGPAVAMYLIFAAGATFQALALREAELGMAYMFSLGLEAVLVFVFGQLFFAESASLSKVLGVAAIIVGMVLVNRGGSDLTEQEQTPEAGQVCSVGLAE
jgi:multidrug transporter EmrE-like cation transporter